MPYYSFCLKCKFDFKKEVGFCPHCATDEWLVDLPFEEKNYED